LPMSCLHFLAQRQSSDSILDTCFFFFDSTGGLNSGLHACEVDALPLEPHAQTLLL
jgi:hypothetical protein